MSDEVKALIENAHQGAADIREHEHESHHCSADLIDRLRVALEDSVQAPAVDREALARELFLSQAYGPRDEAAVVWEAMPFIRESWGIRADQLFSSGILLDAAEVEARGLEKAAEAGKHELVYPSTNTTSLWLIERAQQVREGN